MILLEDLGESVREGLEEVEILQKINRDSIEIFEYNYNRKQKEILSKLRIKSLPNKGLWVFQSEVDDIDCLRNESATVEKTILYLKEDKLFAFLLEMKTSVTKKTLKQSRAKFTCSLVRLSIFLSGNKTFTSLKGVQLFPVGVTCFNENRFHFDYNPHHLDKSPFRKRFLELEFSKEIPNSKTFLRIAPITLPNMSIPVLFFQNPSFLDENEENTEGFEIDFQDLLVY